MPYWNSHSISVEEGKLGYKVLEDDGRSINWKQKYKYHRRRITDKQSILDEQNRAEEKSEINFSYTKKGLASGFYEWCLRRPEDDYSTSIPRDRHKTSQLSPKRNPLDPSFG